MRPWQEAIFFQDVDAIWESDAAAEWERLNQPDAYEKQMRDAALDMGNAIEYLDSAILRLCDASADLSETPMQAKVDSFIETLEDIGCDLKAIKEHWERGERE